MNQLTVQILDVFDSILTIKGSTFKACYIRTESAPNLLALFKVRCASEFTLATGSVIKIDKAFFTYVFAEGDVPSGYGLRIIGYSDLPITTKLSLKFEVEMRGGLAESTRQRTIKYIEPDGKPFCFRLLRFHTDNVRSSMTVPILGFWDMAKELSEYAPSQSVIVKGVLKVSSNGDVEVVAIKLTEPVDNRQQTSVTASM